MNREASRPVLGTARSAVARHASSPAQWRRALLALALPVVLLTTAAASDDFDLVTAEDMRAEQSAPVPRAAPGAGDEAARTRSFGAPRIRVLRPDPDVETSGPLRIELSFTPGPGARIVPGSFRMLYGMLKIDLTDRLAGRAQVKESGVIVEGAKVPRGVHRLVMRVTDDQGQSTEQELRIRVGGPP